MSNFKIIPFLDIESQDQGNIMVQVRYFTNRNMMFYSYRTTKCMNRSTTIFTA